MLFAAIAGVPAAVLAEGAGGTAAPAAPGTFRPAAASTPAASGLFAVEQNEDQKILAGDED